MIGALEHCAERPGACANVFVHNRNIGPAVIVQIANGQLGHGHRVNHARRESAIGLLMQHYQLLHRVVAAHASPDYEVHPPITIHITQLESACELLRDACRYITLLHERSQGRLMPNMQSTRCVHSDQVLATVAVEVDHAD